MDASVNLAASLAYTTTLAKAIAASVHRIDVTCSLDVLVVASTMSAP